MVATVFQVKSIAGGFDKVSLTQPDNTFDSAAGYAVGEVLLVEDGTTWNCISAAPDAAVWAQDYAHDTDIKEANRMLTEVLPKYLFNSFARASDLARVSSIDFSSGTFATLDVDFTDYFIDGDTITLYGSRRNDGPYDVLSVAADELTVEPLPIAKIDDLSSMTLWPMVFPAGLRTIAARMSWYDVYIRPTRTPGTTGESVGSYSYTRQERIGGIEYPYDLTAGLSAYKRPRVI